MNIAIDKDNEYNSLLGLMISSIRVRATQEEISGLKYRDILAIPGAAGNISNSSVTLVTMALPTKRVVFNLSPVEEVATWQLERHIQKIKEK